MILVHEATAGTSESGDARITIIPKPGEGLSLELRGPSVTRFGDDIRTIVLETLSALGVSDAKVSIDEKGALDATIQARLAAACGRAADTAGTPWEALK
ncbi:MAG: citrate lyase acyl carrier protein [Spirochaetes bacterium RIFOXYC1_FULL_54_7]|nr:MAG: citrate lyase acyl carrier protein [Spirochaetes bacterium RIFOXYC1_FULL_54_7]